MKKNHLIIAFFIFSGLIIASGIIGFQMYAESTAKAKVEYKEQTPHVSRPLSVEGKTYTEKITIGAIGDILIHDSVYNDAFNGTTYDFKPMIKDVKDILLQPDILLANQESVLGGVEIGLSNYPSFNSPQEVGDAFIDAGVDIFSTANNHSIDRGERAALSAISYYERMGIPYVGSYKSFEDQKTLRILNKNGIKIAFLSYSYGTNGIPVPKGKEYLVNLIHEGNMKEEIERARQEADLVVMSLHFGNEYQLFPNEYQKELADTLVNAGVDVIFGHHPHVLQPMEWVETDDGRNALVVYSLGNFLSGQKYDYKDIGGMATIDVTKEVGSNGNRVELSNPLFYPTFVAATGYRADFRVVPLKDAGNHGLANAGAKYDEIMKHVTGGLSK